MSYGVYTNDGKHCIAEYIRKGGTSIPVNQSHALREGQFMEQSITLNSRDG